MPDVIFPLENYSDAIKEFEQRLSDKKVKRVNTRGKHRMVEFKDGTKARFVYSKEPLKGYSKLFPETGYKGRGVTLSTEAYKDVLSNDIDLVIHATRDGDYYQSKPEQWRKFLETHGKQVLWKPSKTNEKVLSMPCSELQELTL